MIYAGYRREFKALGCRKIIAEPMNQMSISAEIAHQSASAIITARTNDNRRLYII